MIKPLSTTAHVFLVVSLLFFSSSILHSQTCLSFDGNDDKIRIPSTIGEALGSNDFTLEAYIKGLEENNVAATIISSRNSLNSGFQFFIHPVWSTSEHMMLSLRYAGTNWLLINNGDYNGSILDGQCHHVAVSKIAGQISFYIDGELIGTKNTSSTQDLNAGSPIILGNDDYSFDAFNGSINHVRIWNTGRTDQEIRDGYLSDINIDDENLLGYWEITDNNGQEIIDVAKGNNGILGNEDIVESSDPTWDSECCTPITSSDLKCLLFDGLDDRVEIPETVGVELASSDFTLEAHITGKSEENNAATILSNRNSLNTGFHFFIHQPWGGSQYHMLCFRYNGTNWLFENNGLFNGEILDGQCHHVAITRESSTLSFYIDGVLIGVRENLYVSDISSGSSILIGNDGYSNDAFNGSIDNVRIWNIARTSSEIEEAVDHDIDPESEGLLGYWTLQEGHGQTAKDLTNQYEAMLGITDEVESSDPTWGYECCGPDIVLSIDQVEEFVGHFSVFPNPSYGSINIEMGEVFISDHYTYLIYNTSGQVLVQDRLRTGEINLDRLHSGHYLIEIKRGKTTYGTAKFVHIK